MAGSIDVAQTARARRRRSVSHETGIPPIQNLQIAAWATFYVHVDDVAKTVENARSFGAGIAIPVADGGAIEFARLIDTQGNRFGVWKLNSE